MLLQADKDQGHALICCAMRRQDPVIIIIILYYITISGYFYITEIYSFISLRFYFFVLY